MSLRINHYGDIAQDQERKPMTPEETVAAGHVMISGGPWDQRYRYFWCRDNASDEKWQPCSERPAWNWHEYEYRVRPEPQYCWINVYRSSDGELVHIAHGNRESCDSQEAANGRVGRIKVRLEERFDE